MLENQHLFISVRTSRGYLYFNIFQLVLSLSLLFCFFTSSFQILSLLQILVAFCLALDMYLSSYARIIRYFGEKDFFRQRSSKCDLALLSIITATMVMDILLPARLHHKADILTLIFIAVRYSSQVLRFLLIIKKSIEAKSISTLKEISFSNIDRSDIDDEVNYDRVFRDNLIKGILP